MSDKDKGWIKLHRSIWDNSIWKNKSRFDDRSAWIDLLLMANHEDHEAVYGKTVVKIRRGQLFTSARSLAKRWRWGIGTVNRYLCLLCEIGMLIKDGQANGTLLTIVNYEKYQGERNAEWNASGTQAERERNASGRQTRMYKECNENVEEVNSQPLPSLGGRVYE